MAENRSSSNRQAKASPDQPLLRQGRSADPVPEEDRQEAPDATARIPAKGEGDEASVPADATGEAPTDSNDERVTAVEKTIAESRQRKLRLMLRQCDRVMLMDFDILAMPGWPDNYTVAVARRSRDIWLFCTLVAAITFLSGMTGFVPAWIAGGGFGAFVILLLFGLPAIRGLITRRPSYLDLIIKRRRMLQDARKHIAHLEGAEGLVWQCARLAEFNASLRATRYSELRALSERRAVPKHITRREHVRLYLMYLLEAEKAYGRAEKAFFEGHQQALDQGWESVAARSEGSA
ncbi:hypothetical protein [Marinobacter sp. CHS3-4]|uniref:hypothetical protein n=1 Tax=Marinobacter sp. CHS3-4 TaxID=3045174 RepID=UPI0024B58B29|nr:hypothetical protein [Marinobacter sp. CHS3-4]MDI9245856.1 hypothetical protein [Marinobacter sp. CHS3-4]